MTWTFKLARRLAVGHRSVLSAALMLGSLTACGSSVAGTDDDEIIPPPPTAGWLNIQFDTPRTDDGALQLQLTGPTALDSLKASGYNGYVSKSGNSGQLIVTGTLHGGFVGRFWVRDISRSSEYHVAVVAAAARGTYALQDLQGYSASLKK